MQATAASAETTAAELLAFWTSVMRAGGNRGFFAVLEELGLSVTQAKVLFALDASDDALSVGQLADGLPTSLPNASRLADKLLERGFLARREDPEDRRSKRLTLTADGHAVIDRLDEVRLHDLTTYCAALPEADRARLVAALTALPHAKDRP